MKFRKGDKVICVHDDQESKVGDIKIVEQPRTFCCGGVKFENDPSHYFPDNFEHYVEKETNPMLMVQQSTLHKCLDRFNHSIYFNQRNGVIPVDVVRDCMLNFLNQMGLDKEYFHR